MAGIIEVAMMPTFSSNHDLMHSKSQKKRLSPKSKSEWARATTADGRVYFWNRVSKRTSWTNPGSSKSPPRARRQQPTTGLSRGASRDPISYQPTARQVAARRADDQGQGVRAPNAGAEFSNDVAIARALSETYEAESYEVESLGVETEVVAAFRPSPYPGGRRGAALSLALSLSARSQLDVETDAGAGGESSRQGTRVKTPELEANDLAIAAALAAMEAEPDFTLDASAIESVPRSRQAVEASGPRSRPVTFAAAGGESAGGSTLAHQQGAATAAAASEAPSTRLDCEAPRRPGLKRTATCRGTPPSEGPPAAKRAHECTICLEDIEQPKEATALPCMHVFHAKCAREWLARRASCPICKTPA